MALTVDQQSNIDFFATVGAPSLYMTKIVNADRRTIDNYIQDAGLPTNSTVAASLPHDTPSHIHRQVVHFVEHGKRDQRLLLVILKQLDKTKQEYLLFIRDWNLQLQSKPRDAAPAAEPALASE
jgi:hypothetical protein